MDNNSDDKDSTRKSRNLSEKKRRDQFNNLIIELSSMVTTGSSSSKMDKSTVLKATISLIKAHNDVKLRSRIHEIQETWKPAFLSNEEFTHLMLEALDGFIIVFYMNGEIIYVSENITSLLGYLVNDVVGMNLYELINADERNDLYQDLMKGANSEDRQMSFFCRLRRGKSEKFENASELIHITGHFRPNSEVDDSNLSVPIFVGTAKLQTPQLMKELALVEFRKGEFTSRHSLEWKFLFLDHRAPPIIGYLPFELLGTSGYDYYHVDDLESILKCHDVLIRNGESTSGYYRFLIKGQQWIWLRTHFYITYHQLNKKPEFVVCSHTLVSYADVIKRSFEEESNRGYTRPSSSEYSPMSRFMASPQYLPTQSTSGNSPLVLPPLQVSFHPIDEDIN